MGVVLPFLISEYFLKHMCLSAMLYVQICDHSHHIANTNSALLHSRLYKPHTHTTHIHIHILYARTHTHTRNLELLNFSLLLRTSTVLHVTDPIPIPNLPIFYCTHRDLCFGPITCMWVWGMSYWSNLQTNIPTYLPMLIWYNFLGVHVLFRTTASALYCRYMLIFLV